MAPRRARPDPSAAVGYLRASTDRQDLSPEAQRAAVEGWALRTGRRVVAWCFETASGAAGLEARPGLAAALEALRMHRAGVLVAARRDRVARDVGVALAVERAVGQLGAELHTADGTPAGDDPSSRLLRAVLDAAAEHERALLRVRTREALRALRARGRRAGTVPWGFVAGPGGELAPHEGERATVARALALRAEGRTLRAIVDALAAEGHRARSGRPLSLTQVARVLRGTVATPRGVYAAP